MSEPKSFKFFVSHNFLGDAAVHTDLGEAQEAMENHFGYDRQVVEVTVELPIRPLTRATIVLPEDDPALNVTVKL